MKSTLSHLKIRRPRLARRALAIAALAALVFTLPVTVPDAEAAHGHRNGAYFAAGIQLGGFHVSIGYDRGRGGDYYYRTRDRIHYDDYQCTDRCYRQNRSYYHHERCPVMLHLLHVERIHPHRLFAHHAPRYDGRWSSYDPYDWHRGYLGKRYSDRGRYDRHDRWDRRDRRHRGWDRGRGHHRGHGRHD